ncbi:hypothetical protein JKP88DRAFT_224950 [Tribonema minus]|uniref:Uncharacterized protein n=1 Tax=Tribonema minus TaxID=303371 RepID=A0A836CB15_9STRA|nr:hypothetical protein JKP88DRAFT_224950 [Tribonema minus]
MVADVDLNRKVFQGYELQSVPQVAHFAPEAAPGAGAGWPQADMMPVTKLFTAEDIAQFVGDKTGFRYTIYRSQFAARMALLALLLFLVGALRTAITNVALVLRVVRSPTLWLVVSLLVYTFSISGAIFDIIRSPPPFVISAQTRKPVYFSPQPNSQYVVEGFIVGILNLTTAFCGMVVVAIAPRIKARALRQTVTLAAAALFGLLFALSVTIYTWKNRWYMAR